MKFIPIDRSQWSREPYFEHYMNNVRCTFSLTANLDIARLLKATKRQGIKLYPVLLHMIATVVNRHREFRTCVNAEGTLGYWECLSPSYTIFHNEDQTFSNLWTLYDPGFSTFYKRYLEDGEAYGHVKRFASKADEPPSTFPISCIPWVPFTSFNLNVYNDGAYLLPIFTIGKYVVQEDHVWLPVAVQFHHAVCDGYHAGLLYEELQIAH